MLIKVNAEKYIKSQITSILCTLRDEDNSEIIAEEITKFILEILKNNDNNDDDDDDDSESSCCDFDNSENVRRRCSDNSKSETLRFNPLNAQIIDTVSKNIF